MDNLEEDADDKFMAVMKSKEGAFDTLALFVLILGCLSFILFMSVGFVENRFNEVKHYLPMSAGTCILAAIIFCLPGICLKFLSEYYGKKRKNKKE